MYRAGIGVTPAVSGQRTLLMTTYSHCDQQFGRLKSVLDANLDPQESRLAVKWILEYFNYLLSDSDRSHENLVFTSADELLNEEHDGPVRDHVWGWVTQLARTADEHRRKVMDVCIYERIVEDEPIEWDWRTLSMFTLWFDVRTHWVLEQAYSFFPERLEEDLKQFARLCTDQWDRSAK